MKQKILPSLMPKNQKELNEDFKKLKGVAKHLHLDVIDGKFAPNNTLQFPFRLSKNFQYSAHLMIKNPETWIKKHFQKIELFIPQFEEIKHKEDYIVWMKKNNKKIAFAIKPETKVKELKPYLPFTDYVLVLTVHPGFYGSKFLPKKIKKIKEIKKLNPKTKVIIDGGMNPKTIRKASKAGADFFVSGSYTTKAEYPKESIKNLLKEIKQ
jgi:ribulose-phosphate 3-epimerase